MDSFFKGLAILLVTVCLFLNPVRLNATGIQEYQVKAVFLYNFAYFVTFPEYQIINSSIFSFCIFGNGLFKHALQLTLEDQDIAGKTLQLIELAENDSPADCHIVYFPKSLQNRYTEILSRLKNKPVLTVSDIPDFALNGGMIEFTRIDNQIKLKINNNNAIKTGLLIKANLLSISTLVNQ